MLRVENVYKNFGGILALNGVSFSVEPNTITGLIGPNGSGKTTLFNVISGFYTKDRGRTQHYYRADWSKWIGQNHPL